MGRYYNVDIFGIIECHRTRRRWSAIPNAKKLFGEELSNFLQVSPIQFDEPEIPAIDSGKDTLISVGLAFSEKCPQDVYPYFIVDWTELRWMRMQEYANNFTRKQNLQDSMTSLAVAMGSKEDFQTDKDAQLKQSLLSNIMDNNGAVNLSLVTLGIPKKVYDRWVLTDPVFKEQLQLTRDCLLDEVESSMFKTIKGGGMGAAQLTKYVLDTHGTDRGYGVQDTGKSKEEPLVLDYSKCSIEELKLFNALLEKMQPDVIGESPRIESK